MAYAIPDIPNAALTISIIPAPDADWAVVARFALTFDGYKLWGDRCAEIASTRPDKTLTELRTCLFFEQRRWRWEESEPDEATRAYIRSVLEKIRSKVTAGDLA